MKQTLLFNSSISFSFDPTNGTGKMMDYAYFFDQDRNKSIQYTTAAGLVVLLKFPDFSQVGITYFIP